MIRLSVAGLCLLTATSVRAGEWRYCLSVNSADKKVYVTQPFASDKSSTVLAEAFDEVLSRGALLHGGCQCPRSDIERISRQSRQGAIDYNRKKGIEPVSISWRPND